MQIKKLFNILLLALSCTITLSASAGNEAADTLTARYLFLHCPGDALDLIPESTRADMLDFFDAGRAYSPLNKLRGKSTLQALSRDYAKVQVSDVSNLQLMVLPSGKKQVAALIYTVDAGHSPDSQISFYDSALNPLKLKNYFTEPTLKDFLKNTPEAESLQSLVPFLLVSYRLDASKNPPTLTATLNLEGSMTEEDLKLVRPQLERDSITYSWTGKRFALQKP